jgi:hypothetical protein
MLDIGLSARIRSHSVGLAIVQENDRAPKKTPSRFHFHRNIPSMEVKPLPVQSNTTRRLNEQAPGEVSPFPA